ncbi:hypothetical protein FS837_011373 [Tulasnella sp. UAMH 9824]|nr:hypothetical protein FS837_011373 [Tulasnella sp. UAMH 9824]
MLIGGGIIRQSALAYIRIAIAAISGTWASFVPIPSIATPSVALKEPTTPEVMALQLLEARIYLMADDNTYETFNLLAKEFAFDVDVSKLPRGIAADAHFSEIAADGGMAQSDAWNTAGAKYGTGYCNSRCPRDLKFINGRINFPWRPTGLTTGVGWYGSCCAEMDLWQANSVSTAFTARPCLFEGQYVCLEDTVDCGASSPSGDDRYDGVCDPDGCDYNPYRLGNPSYYGSGSSKTVDSSKKITVVTQFITDNATPDGTLAEIRRLYVQNGVVISNAHFNVVGVPTSFDSITPDYCDHQKAAFGDATSFQNHGGFQSMSSALQRGMVLALSIYDDPEANQSWLDSSYPVGATGSEVARGTCPTNSGVPSDVEVQYINAYVTFSNIKFGPIGSTY